MGRAFQERDRGKRRGGADDGSKEFVNEAFANARERFGAKRKDGARAMKGSGKGAKGGAVERSGSPSRSLKPRDSCDYRPFFDDRDSFLEDPNSLYELASLRRKRFISSMAFESFHDRLPELNLGSPQSRHADAILQLFINTLLPQADYIERVKRHYTLFRATVDRPRNPLLRRRRTGD